MEIANEKIAIGKYLTADQCAARYGFSVRHWFRMVDGGKAPRPTKFNRLCRWPITQLEEWESRGCQKIVRAT